MPLRLQPEYTAEISGHWWLEMRNRMESKTKPNPTQQIKEALQGAQEAKADGRDGNNEKRKYRVWRETYH